MKKVNKLLIVVVSFLLTLTGCTHVDNDEIINETATIATSEIGSDVQVDDVPEADDNTHAEYDEILLEYAAMITSETSFGHKMENPFVTGNRYFDVTKTEEGYLVDVNGTEMRIQIPSNSPEVYEPKEISETSEKHQKVISHSKELVYQYINASKVLKNKDDLKEYIDKIAIKEAYFTYDKNVGAYYSHEDNTLYINKYAIDAVCEWMIAHEFVHAIAYYTHECEIGKETYAFNLFTEIITDMITASMKPNIANGALSGYSLYYDLVCPYINLFGEKSIEAYYYGYDTIYEKIEKNEFDFFVLVIQNYGAENTEAYYNNLIFKWYAKLI